MKQTIPQNSVRQILSLLLVVVGVGFYFYETLLEVVPASMLESLMQSFHLDAKRVGILDTAYFFTYALMQIPAGLLLDRFNTRYVLALAAFLCFIGALLLSVTQHFYLALVFRLMMGLGGSFGLLSAMFLIRRYLPERYLAFCLGLAVTVGLSGGLLQTSFTHVVEHTGWRALMFALSLTALFFVLAFWLFSPSNKTHKLQISTVGTSEKFLFSMKNLLRKPNNWFIALYGGLMYVPTGTLGVFWGINYLKTYFPNEQITSIAFVSSLLFMGWMVGSPLVGRISDKLNRRKPVIVLGSIGIFVCLVFMAYLDVSFLAMAVLMFSLGFFSSCGALAFAMISENNTRKEAGVSLGFANLIAILPSLFVTPLFGALLDHYWLGATTSGVRIYPSHAYQMAMLSELACIVLSFFLAYFLIRETYK